MQKDAIMYAHGSAYNHGCEAIVRATVDLLDLDKEKTVLFSNKIEGDLGYHLDDIITVKPIAETPVDPNSLKGISYRVRSRLYENRVQMYSRFFAEDRFEYMYGFGDVAISIGGDNYCYKNALADLENRNYWLNRKGFKTMLWGASLTEEFMFPSVVDDLNRYSLISVREHMSYDLLKSHGIKSEVVVGADPAFALPVIETPWPDGKEHSRIIGINISPFVQELSANENSGLNNYIKLIDWILNETDYEIALIPHVVFPDSNSNDILLSNMIIEKYPQCGRLIALDDRYNCCELKSLISKCSFFVGARTHATIAAYSTGVPTLVVGYSIKSIGIARDLFGTDTDFVCPVQDMTDDNMLLERFKKLFARKEEISRKLLSFMPEYLAGQQICIEAAKSLIIK